MPRSNGIVFLQAMSGILRRLAAKEWTPGHKQSLLEIEAKLKRDFDIVTMLPGQEDEPASISLTERGVGPTFTLDIHWNHTHQRQCVALADVLDLYLQHEKAQRKAKVPVHG